MGNFSKDPLQELLRSRERGYVGLHLEQGVPVLDRDLNLLADLVAASVRDVLARHLGDGIAEQSDAFAVEAVAADNDFLVAAPRGGGTCLVAGIQVRIDAPLRYGGQPGAAPLTTPREGRRDDVVYLDVWVEEVDAAADPVLENRSDVGMQTSVRLRPAWCVRVAEGTRRVPPPLAGHAHCALAMLERRGGEPAISDPMIVDLRRTGLHLGELARRVQRLEDVLFSPAPGWLEQPPSAGVVEEARGGRPPAAGEPTSATEPTPSRREYAT